MLGNASKLAIDQFQMLVFFLNFTKEKYLIQAMS